MRFNPFATQLVVLNKKNKQIFRVLKRRQKKRLVFLAWQYVPETVADIFWFIVFQIRLFWFIPYVYLFMSSFNPFSAGTAFMLMQTGWIQASRRVTRRLAWDPNCLLLRPSFPIKKQQIWKVLKSRRQYNIFLENYPAFKGLTLRLPSTT